MTDEIESGDTVQIEGTVTESRDPDVSSGVRREDDGDEPKPDPDEEG